MLAVRYAYVLALVIWLGGMIAPLLARFHYVEYGAGAVLLLTLVAMRILGPKPASFAIRALIVLVMLGIALYSGMVAAAPSNRLMTASIVGGLALLYWEAREQP
jgi:hypothetical protein